MHAHALLPDTAACTRPPERPPARHPSAVNVERKEVMVFGCTGLVLVMTSDGPGFWVGALPLGRQRGGISRAASLPGPLADPAPAASLPATSSSGQAGMQAEASRALPCGPPSLPQLAKMDDVVAAGMTHRHQDGGGGGPGGRLP